MLAPIPIDNLFILAGILATELRRKRAMLSLARRAQKSERIFNKRLLSTLYKEHRQLKLRHPFVPAALKILKDFFESDNSVACWTETKWITVWQSNISRLTTFNPDVNPKALRMYLLRPTWVRLNRLHTDVGLLYSTVHKWDMAPTTASECGVKKQTAYHIIRSCSIFHHPSKVLGFEAVDEETVVWVNNTCPNI